MALIPAIMMTHSNPSPVMSFRRTPPTPFPPSCAIRISSPPRILLFLLLLFLLTPGGRTVTAGIRPANPYKRPLCVVHLDPMNPHILTPHHNCSSPTMPSHQFADESPSASDITSISSILTDLTCIETDDLTCSKVRKAFDSVAAKIGRAVWLSAPIKVNATFYP